MNLKEYKKSIIIKLSIYFPIIRVWQREEAHWTDNRDFTSQELSKEWGQTQEKWCKHLTQKTAKNICNQKGFVGLDESSLSSNEKGYNNCLQKKRNARQRKFPWVFLCYKKTRGTKADGLGISVLTKIHLQNTDTLNWRR